MGGGWNWVRKGYTEPLQFYSRDKIISVRGDMTNNNQAKIKIEVGPYEWWLSRQSKLNAPPMPLIDYNVGRKPGNNEYYQYLMDLEMNLLIGIGAGLMFLICFVIFGVSLCINYIVCIYKRKNEKGLEISEQI